MDFHGPPGSLIYKGIDSPLDISIDFFHFVLATKIVLGVQQMNGVSCVGSWFAVPCDFA
jgi:hypothetical protein